MTSYVDIPEMRRYLDQVPEDPDTDLLLQDILDRATSMIDTYLGFSYAPYPDAGADEETDKIVFGGGSSLLTLPPHQIGSVITIVPEDGTPVDDTTYTEQADGTIYLDSSHVAYPAPYASLSRYPGWGFYRYTVTANWGYGPVPEAVKEVCLQLAMTTWKGKDKGFMTDFIGANGTSGQRFTGGLPRPLRDVLEIEKAKWGGGVVIA